MIYAKLTSLQLCIITKSVLYSMLLVNKKILWKTQLVKQKKVMLQ
jgi:hypothetical protein